MLPVTNLYLDLIGIHKGKNDLTFVLNTSEMENLVACVAQQEFDTWSVEHRGAFHYVSVQSDAFFAEDAYTLEGELKFNDTDILVLPNYINDDFEFELISNGEYNAIIKL